jgi:serine protease Do
MTSTTPSTTSKPRRFTPRRLVLLAGVAALGLSAYTFIPGTSPSALKPWSSSVFAAETARPVGFADIVEKVKPAVISVRVKMGAGPQLSLGEESPFPPGSPFERFFRRGQPDMAPGIPRQPRRSMGQGSGFFITADGFAVTNNHVVDKAESVEVTTDDGKVYPAKVIGADSRTDLALIKVEGRTDFPYVKLADSTPRIGDWVIAVGNPFGLGGTVTAGIVSARGRDIGAGPYDDFIQIDAPVNKGNSGGPTFDMDGNVIGVNTAIFSPSGGSVGIAFAIPAETAKTVILQLRDKGSVVRGWIGVQIQTITPEIAEGLGLKHLDGALVAETQPDSPAAKAGVTSRDVIVSVNDVPVRDSRDLAKRIGAMAPGSSVKLGVVRKGEEQVVTVALGELPTTREARAPAPGEREVPGSDLSRLGLTLSPGGRGDGVMVTAVDPSGLAADRGFRVGDVILDIGGRTVGTPADVRKALTDARTEGKRSVLMRVKSGEAMKFVAVPLGRG